MGYGPRALPQHLHVPLMSVPKMLGMSRCTQLRVTCRDWSEACSTDVFDPPAGFREVFKSCPADDVWPRRLACMAILDVLGAPDFAERALNVVEDDVHWLLAHVWTKSWVEKMLQSTFRIRAVDQLAKWTAELRPKCKLPGVVLDVIFQLRSPVMLALQPIHCAVLLSSSSVLKKLLSAATHVARLLTDSSSEETNHDSVSPLFLAVLFAEKDVVDVLRCHGACLNGVDAKAAMRLQGAFLWADLEERLISLQLDAEADKLAKTVDELRRDVERAAELDFAARHERDA